MMVDIVVLFLVVSGLVQWADSQRCEVQGKFCETICSCAVAHSRCSLPTSPQNGRVEWLRDENVVYMCDEGYMLEGRAVRQCDRKSGRLEQYGSQRCVEKDYPETEGTKNETVTYPETEEIKNETVTRNTLEYLKSPCMLISFTAVFISIFLLITLAIVIVHYKRKISNLNNSQVSISLSALNGTAEEPIVARAREESSNFFLPGPSTGPCSKNLSYTEDEYEDITPHFNNQSDSRLKSKTEDNDTNLPDPAVGYDYARRDSVLNPSWCK